MDGTGDCYAKRNKPGRERQIPYDLTYKWNLINKTNNRVMEMTLYDKSHKEQTDSDQRQGERGDNGGKKGKGH